MKMRAMKSELIEALRQHLGDKTEWEIEIENVRTPVEIPYDPADPCQDFNQRQFIPGPTVQKVITLREIVDAPVGR